MDPDAPQSSVPVTSPQAPDDDASDIALPQTSPPELAQQPPDDAATPAPEPDDDAAPATTPPQSDATSGTDAMLVTESAPVAAPSADSLSAPAISPVAATDAPAIADPFDPHSADEISFLKNVLGPRSAASLHARTASHLEQVMDFARKKGTVDRTDVRLLLRVSASTATSYLDALYKSGRLTRHHTQTDTVYKVVE